MKSNYIRWFLFLTVLIALVIIASLYSLSTGELNISLLKVPSILQQGEGMEFMILTKIRLPRVLLAIAVGGALSLTGVILQGIYRNPLVEPYTLGISGGAAFGVALAIVFGLQAIVGEFMLPIAGFIGSFVSIFLVYFLSLKKGSLSINRMLLIGVMISFIASSGMMFLMSITNVENMHSIVFWIMGSLDEPSITLVRTMFYLSFGILFLTMLFSKPLNALRLGEEKARHLGINTGLVIKILFILSSLLTGMSVAVAGVIGFVGLIIPHIVRLIVGSDYRILLMSSFLSGGFFLLVCDVIARTIIAPNELPIGVITGMLGGVIFIFLLARGAGKSKSL